MSTAMNFGSKSFKPRAPDKGSFPLDHFGKLTRSPPCYVGSAPVKELIFISRHISCLFSRAETNTEWSKTTCSYLSALSIRHIFIYLFFYILLQIFLAIKMQLLTEALSVSPVYKHYMQVTLTTTSFQTKMSTV